MLKPRSDPTNSSEVHLRADGTFVTTPGSMITKCPSKYQAAKS